MDFKDKNVVVVGGTSGIGASLIERLKKADANIWNLSRSKSEVNGVKNIEVDIMNDVKDLDLPDEVHGLVYCPGSINLKPFQSLSTDDFQKDFDINVKGAVKVLQAVSKNLKKSKNGSVVMFSTVAVKQGMNFHTSIAAAKGAVEGVVRSLAAEWSRSNIRVNAVAPSLTDTPMASNLLSSDEKKKTSAERHPIKRVGTPDDMAEAALFLLSDNSSWMTGEILHVDGGLSSLNLI